MLVLMLRKYFGFIVNHAYVVMGLIAAATVFFVTHVGSVRTEIDPKQILPQTHPYIETNTRIEQLFGGGRVIIVGVAAKKGDIFTPSFLAKIDRLTREIKTIPGIYADNVLSIASRKVKNLRFNEEGFDVERLMPVVPETQTEADAIRDRVFNNPLYVGALVSADATAAAIIIDVQDTESARQSGAVVGEASRKPAGDLALYEALRRVTEKEEDVEAEIHLGGLPVSLAFLEKDAALMNTLVFPVAFLVIMLVHYRAFKTLQGMLIPALTAFLSGFWALGLIGFLEMRIDLWTKGLTPILIVATAAGHSVQILRRFYEALEYAIGMDVPEPAQKTAVIEATSKMAPVTLSAGFVAAASFASLITFKLPTFQSFGLMTSFGILSALVLEMTLIPALRSLIPPPSGEEMSVVLARPASGRLLSAFGAWALSPVRKRVLWGGVVVFLVPLAFSTQIPRANSLRNLFFDRTDLRRDDAVLNEKFGGTSTLNVLVTTQKPGGLKNPDIMRAMGGLQAELKKNPMVGRTESYVDYVKGMRRSFYGGDEKEAQVPATREEAAQFLFLYSVSGNPDDFKRVADVSFQHAVLMTFLKSDATELAEDLIPRIQAYASEHFPPGVSIGFAGSVPVTLALNQVIIRGKLLNIAQMILICFLMASVVFRSPTAGLFVLIPLLISLAWNFGFLGMTGIPLGVSTAAASAISVGLGADYAIYILYRFRDELSVNRHLERVVNITLTTAGHAVFLVAAAFGIGTLLVAFPGYYLHIEGILMPLAMLTSALAAVIILPSLVMAFRPKFMFRVRPSEWIELHTRGEFQKYNVDGDVLRPPADTQKTD
ncbi:MAG: RND family transporter [Nitrospiria bacterium]